QRPRGGGRDELVLGELLHDEAAEAHAHAGEQDADEAGNAADRQHLGLAARQAEEVRRRELDHPDEKGIEAQSDEHGDEVSSLHDAPFGNGRGHTPRSGTRSPLDSFSQSLLLGHPKSSSKVMGTSPVVKGNMSKERGTWGNENGLEAALPARPAAARPAAAGSRPSR